MRRPALPRPSYANVTATLALFVALGGVSWAAVKLPRNSVGTAQIRKDAVTGAKVRNGTLRAADFARGTLLSGPQGAQGPAGAAGAQGPAGPSSVLLRPNQPGTLISPVQASPTTVASIALAPGAYYLEGVVDGQNQPAAVFSTLSCDLDTGSAEPEDRDFGGMAFPNVANAPGSATLHAIRTVASGTVTAKLTCFGSAPGVRASASLAAIQVGRATAP